VKSLGYPNEYVQSFSVLANIRLPKNAFAVYDTMFSTEIKLMNFESRLEINLLGLVLCGLNREVIKGNPI